MVVVLRHHDRAHPPEIVAMNMKEWISSDWIGMKMMSGKDRVLREPKQKRWAPAMAVPLQLQKLSPSLVRKSSHPPARDHMDAYPHAAPRDG
jgi:hypothetical protein